MIDQHDSAVFGIEAKTGREMVNAFLDGGTVGDSSAKMCFTEGNVCKKHSRCGEK